MPSFSKTMISLLLLATAAIAAPTPQLAGEGAAANSILSSTDNGVGYGIENAENNVAGNIASVKGTAGGAAAPLPPQLARRQLDKIANGSRPLPTLRVLDKPPHRSLGLNTIWMAV